MRRRTPSAHSQFVVSWEEMTGLRRADLRAALDVVESLAATGGPDPFPLPVLSELQRLVDADAGSGYVETTVTDACSGYQLATRPQPPWTFSALEQVGHQDPTHAVHCHAVTAPVAISDFLTQRQFHRLDVFGLVCGPLGVSDSLRLYLPAPSGRARFFFFDRSRRAFPERAKELLALLRPHLTQARGRYRELATSRIGMLTQRESEILRWVASGATNAEVARQLWVTEHTVRKHLENIYGKLDVHTRTAAIARARAHDPIVPPA